MIVIDNYQMVDFTVNGYRVYDEYTPPTKSRQNGDYGQDEDFYGRYTILIESPLIDNTKNLSVAVKGSNSIATLITLLAKCFLGEAVNTPEKYLDTFTKELDTVDNPIDGWESNHMAVRKLLHQKGKCIILSLNAYAHRLFQTEINPFIDLEKAMNAYSNLREPLKDLLLIINDVDLVSASSRYMLLGKAIEIVDDLYPLVGQNNEDHRIMSLFPCIADSFNGVTIHNLRGISNTRKETRHYFDKQRVIHPEMTCDELKSYYIYTNLLCVNVVRRELGLAPQVF